MPEQQTLFRDKPLLDAYEQQLAQDWLPLEISQISAGNYQGQLRELRQDSVSVFFEHQNCMVHKRGVMDERFCTVSFVRTANPQLRFSEYSATDNSLFFLPGGAEFDIQVEADTETVYFRFDQALLLERARAMNPTVWEVAPDKLAIFDAIDRKSLDAFSNYLFANPMFQANHEVVHAGDLLGMSILDQVVMTLSSSSINEVAYPDLMVRRRARSLVTRAIEYINAAMDNQLCPSIVDVSVDLNVSQRNLQYSFKKVLGFTPNAYIYRLRLNRVRARLSRPADADVTVTSVATHWHFCHLGRFANDYQKLFAELPSTTLRRARA